MSDAEPLLHALDLVTQTLRNGVGVCVGYPHNGSCGILSGPCTCGTRVLIASYQKHFDFLWSREASRGRGSLADWLMGAQVDERTVVVIDDYSANPDPHGILVSDHISPYDWAVMLSLWATASLWATQTRFDQEVRPDQDGIPQKGQIPRLRILVITPEQSPVSRAPGRQRFAALAGCLPWLQSYGALGSEPDARYALPARPDELAHLRTALRVGTFGFQDLLEDLAHPTRIRDLRSVVDESPDDTATGMRAVAAAWYADLVKPETRHAVANYLAPKLLAEALPASFRGRVKLVETSERRALTRLSRMVGLRTGNRDAPHIPRSGTIGRARSAGVPFLDSNPLFLLVDDQFDLGYAEIIAAILFGERKTTEVYGEAPGRKADPGEPRGELRCLRGPREILDELPRERIDNWKAPRLLRWHGRGLAGVLLDLRLWATPEGAAAVQAEVAAAALRLGADAIDSPALKSALASVEQGRPDSIEALTLLPLLLSHYDASLPIVLFSSTHQRQVVEAVAHRHNIITTFSKPLLSGYDSVADELGSLISATDEVLRLQSARHLWSRITGMTLSKPYPDQIETVRVILSEIVWHYLIDSRPYDLLSVPYEYLEGRLGEHLVRNAKGAHIGDGAEASRHRTEAMGSWAGERRGTMEALKWLRNRKVHGVGWSRIHSDEKALEHVAPILCALLLDFIDGTYEAGARLAQLPRSHSVSLLVAALSQTIEPKRIRREVLRMVLTDSTIPWSTAAAYVLERVLGSKTPLERGTIEACTGFVSQW